MRSNDATSTACILPRLNGVTSAPSLRAIHGILLGGGDVAESDGIPDAGLVEESWDADAIKTRRVRKGRCHGRLPMGKRNQAASGGSIASSSGSCEGDFTIDNQTMLTIHIGLRVS